MSDKIESREFITTSPCEIFKDSVIRRFPILVEKPPSILFEKDKFYNQPSFTVYIYSEDNTEINSKVCSYLYKISQHVSRKDFVYKVRNNIRNFRYCLQTDIHRAMYMFNYEKTLELIDRYIKDEEISKYLISFFKRIAEVEEERFLYITVYSPALLTLFISKMIPADIKTDIFVDDVLFYANDNKTLVKTLESFREALEGYNLYINDKKTIFTDTAKESLIVLCMVVHVPNHILDIKLKNHLKQKVFDDENIVLFKPSLDISLYVSSLRREMCRLEQKDIVLENDNFINRFFSMCKEIMIRLSNVEERGNSYICYKTVKDYDTECDTERDTERDIKRVRGYGYAW